ncbi:heme peroxidase [Immersiella caudata]|uniref:Heme peroxidase n=1 Tax=Immersiella caudata TaxID=314043 RepID=A0AA39WBG9_9PEZI|nr:heme peroxidase [Immersiella caudata]
MESYKNGATNGSKEVNGSKTPSSASSIDTGEKLASLAKPRPTPLVVQSTTADRKGVKNAFEQYAQVVQATVKPLPHQGGAGTKTQKWGKLTDDIKTLRAADFKTLKAVVVGKIKGEKIKDDKTMLMEQVIQLVSNLRSDSKLRAELTNSFVKELWETLDHPPMLYVGEKHMYRQADGSNNNPMFPSLGAAGCTYARSVNTTVIRQGALPDPNLIYDSVMKRTEYKKHPNNVSSILWNWAAIIIHDLFWTDYRDMTKSKTSSYLDLSPLYGSNQEMQDTIRTFKDGKLKPDCFADKRLLGMPPGVGVMLIMFNRFHNHVAEHLAAINEDGRFTAPAANVEGEKKDAAWKKYDNDLFQTARLITSGLYINITLIDYVRNIINLNRIDTEWTLDPRVNTGIAVGTNDGAERGTGNVVSAEFNLCYRWHSCISEKDDKWIQDFYHELFGKPASEVTVPDLIGGFGKFERSIPEDPQERPFNKFKRGADGKFNDDDLVECITSVIEDPAGSFGGRNVPQSMRAVEILGIIQARKWNVSGLNEFRKHFGLKPYEKFEDINSDPDIAESLRRLYDHPDFVELYPGLVAEENKEPMVPGVGIAPTYTISRVVLSDAVCLVRGDRHYTTDYSPRNLTNWGYNEVQYDLKINHGCVFYKLFIRAFPHHFKPNSIYAHYPMVIPSETEKIQKDLKRAHLFDFSRPARFDPLPKATTYDAVKSVGEKPTEYRSTWHDALQQLLAQGGSKVTLSGDSAHHDSQRYTAQQELCTSEVIEQIREFYRKTTERLVAESSYNLAGRRFADVIRDIGNIVPVHFAARAFNLPLKTHDNEKGIYTEHELYAVVSVIYAAIFQALDPVKTFPVEQAARTFATQLVSSFESNIKSTKGFYSSASKKSEPVSAFGANLVKALSKSSKDAAWTQVLPTIVALVATQAETFARAIDFYLSPAGAPHLPSIHALATAPPTAESSALLLGYALEGSRLAGPSGSYLSSTSPSSPETTTNKLYTSHCPQDPTLFPNPTAVDPRRPLESYLQYSSPSTSGNGSATGGAHAILGAEVGHVALTEMFRGVMAKRGVQRAPGAQGELKKVVEEGERVQYLREDWGALVSLPVTMKVCWEEE